MDIYAPQEDSYLLQKWVRELASGRVLDVGTGSGIQALTAAESKNVKEILAIDINEEALLQLKQKTKLLRKIQIKKSNLFENVDSKFDTIIFNPPYLPQDKGIEDSALYGGKKGWEISERFFNEVSKYLVAKGKILFLFSSYTNKEKIEEILQHHLLSFKELESKKFPFFEELYVYVIEKSELLRELERKGIEQVHYLAKGKRGIVYSGVWKTQNQVKLHFATEKLLKVAIKTENPRSTALSRMENESKWLERLNREDIGAKLYFFGTNYLVMEFISGERWGEWLKDKNKGEIKEVIIKILKQLYRLDQLKVNKEELHHPYKHILVTNEGEPVLIDFERCKETEKPTNITQFLECLCRMKEELEERGVKVEVEGMRKLSGEYKSNYSIQQFKEIQEMIINCSST
ncbi:MAG: HemK2/MTQ2 family protein methyltransferase [Nanoarchaeota archaeon]